MEYNIKVASEKTALTSFLFRGPEISTDDPGKGNNLPLI